MLAADVVVRAALPPPSAPASAASELSRGGSEMPICSLCECERECECEGECEGEGKGEGEGGRGGVSGVVARG